MSPKARVGSNPIPGTNHFTKPNKMNLELRVVKYYEKYTHLELDPTKTPYVEDVPVYKIQLVMFDEDKVLNVQEPSHSTSNPKAVQRHLLKCLEAFNKPVLQRVKPHHDKDEYTYIEISETIS